MENQPNSKPVVTIAYVYPQGESQFDAEAKRFVRSFLSCNPQYPCNMVVIVNGGVIDDGVRDVFKNIHGCQFFQHDDTGWDIGAFLALARSRLDISMLFCCGGPTTFTRPGWLRKVMEAWNEYGPGMYGTNASYEVRPHLNTSGFLIPRTLLANYPGMPDTRFARYEFEWGKGSLWRRVRRAGYFTMLVTWDGVWYPEEWRKPKNGYRDGDQSNCLTWFSHSHKFMEAAPSMRKRAAELANGLHNNPPCKLALEVDAASPEKKFV